MPSFHFRVSPYPVNPVHPCSFPFQRHQLVQLREPVVDHLEVRRFGSGLPTVSQYPFYVRGIDQHKKPLSLFWSHTLDGCWKASHIESNQNQAGQHLNLYDDSISFVLRPTCISAIRCPIRPGRWECQDKPNIDAIDSAMSDFVKNSKAAGVITLLGQNGKVVHIGSVGFANIKSNKAMRPNALFSVASMTKPIVATAIMMLDEEGKLSIDDKVSKHIPAFAKAILENGEKPHREITIRDAITHTSGLAGSQSFPGTLSESIDELSTRPLAFHPGEKWQYSPGLNVAGRIIEIVSGKSLQAFLQDRLLTPLGMKNTTFEPNKNQLKRLATLYAPGEDKESLVPVDNRIVNLANVKGANPSGGLVSNARDLFRFYQMILNEGRFRGKRLLSQESVESMTTPKIGDLKTVFTPGNTWGLGWCIVREPQGVTQMLSPGSFGHGGAFGTQGWIDPEHRTIYVLLIQRTRFGNSDASEIRKQFQQVAKNVRDANSN